MAYKLTYTNPAHPKDAEFDIPGVGLVGNGKTKTLTAEDEAAFESRNGMTLKEAAKGDGNVKLEGTTELSKGGES